MPNIGLDLPSPLTKAAEGQDFPWFYVNRGQLKAMLAAMGNRDEARIDVCGNAYFRVRTVGPEGELGQPEDIFPLYPDSGPLAP